MDWGSNFGLKLGSLYSHQKGLILSPSFGLTKAKLGYP